MGTCCTSPLLKSQKYIEPPNIQDQSYSKQWFLQEVSKQSMNKLPYSAIGLIECQIHLMENGHKRIERRSGTGSLISSNLVLTCAHILFKKTTNSTQICSIQKLNFYPAIQGKSKESIRVSNFYYPFQFTLQQLHNDREYDYALLKLQKKVTQKKFMKLGQNFNFFQTDSPIAKPNSKEMNTIIGTLKLINMEQGLKICSFLLIMVFSHLQFHIKIFTEMGHSGSPVILFTRNIDVLIAIHLGKACGQFTNEGRLIQDSMYCNLIKWQEDCQGDPFQRVILNFVPQYRPEFKPPINIEKPFEFNWNRFGVYSKCFLIVKRKIYKIIEGFSYISCEKQLPQITKLRIRISKYQGCNFSFGIANKINTLKESRRFDSEQTVLFHSNRIQRKISIFMNSKTIVSKNRYLFVGEGGIIKVQMNTKMKTISFKNESNNSKFSFDISDISSNKPLFFYVILDAVGDSIEIIEGQ